MFQPKDYSWNDWNEIWSPHKCKKGKLNRQFGSWLLLYTITLPFIVFFFFFLSLSGQDPSLSLDHFFLRSCSTIKIWRILQQFFHRRGKSMFCNYRYVQIWAICATVTSHFWHVHVWSLLMRFGNPHSYACMHLYQIFFSYSPHGYMQWYWCESWAMEVNYHKVNFLHRHPHYHDQFLELWKR